MKKELKIYIAGKVNKNSSFGTTHWRDAFCKELERVSGFLIKNLDPTKPLPGEALNNGDPDYIFGRDAFLIKSADIVLVYLSDDISVGGSQEMLIAKYFNKPLIGLAPYEGKFKKSVKEIGGKVYKNYTNPFVAVPCDYVIETVEAAGLVLKKHFKRERNTKGLSLIDDAVNYYKKELYFNNNPVYFSTSDWHIAHKGLIIDLRKKRMLTVRYADREGISSKVRGKLGLPGGKVIGSDGNSRDFITRVREETGVTVRKKLPFSIWSFSYERRQIVYDILSIGFLAHYESGEICDPIKNNEEDLDRAEWVSLDKVKEDDFISEEKIVVQNFFEYVRANPFAIA